jgi:pyruvate/2-oxoglutarate dehydrogenase complex dihydrolipoamide acyltransferase (E2) component
VEVAQTAAAGNSFEERVRTKSSPLVRKMAAEHGIEITGMQGSGIAGRVTKRDLEAAIAGGGVPGAGRRGRVGGRRRRGAHAAGDRRGGGAGRPGRQVPGQRQRRAAGRRPPRRPRAPAVESMPGDVVEPMSRIRQLTAEHMVLSRRWNAHVTSFFEVDLTRVARIRAKQRAEFERATGEKLTFLPFIIKAVTDGLKQYPALNAAVRGTDVVLRKQYNIGIAVALDWGLIVPVIKNADDLSLTGLTRQLNDLANRARAKKLQPAEVQGATFTITNPGVFGSLMGTPIIPVPTSGIMGVGAIEKRPKVVTGPDGEDTIAVARAATSRSRSTTASSTAPTPTGSWRTSRSRSRASPRRGCSEPLTPVPRALAIAISCSTTPSARPTGRASPYAWPARAPTACTSGCSPSRGAQRRAPESASSSSSRQRVPRRSRRLSPATSCWRKGSTSGTPLPRRRTRRAGRATPASRTADADPTLRPTSRIPPMPIRTITVDGRSWQVYPSGFTTSTSSTSRGDLRRRGGPTTARCASRLPRPPGNRGSRAALGEMSDAGPRRRCSRNSQSK